MPKILHQTFPEGGIAIWHIEESSDELHDMLHVHCYDEQLQKITNETRRAEWLAVRVLLAEVLGPDKAIAYHTTGRPYLTDNSFYISISHTKGYAALVYHNVALVGIDIERTSDRVKRVAHRFTNADEALYINKIDEQKQLAYYLLNWSVKETLYKKLDTPSAADFQKAFTIHSYDIAENGIVRVSVHIPMEQEIKVHYSVCKEYVCTWA